MVHFTTESGEAPPWDVSLKGEKESTFPWRERERSRVGDLNLNHFHYLREKALWFQVLRTVVRKKTECGVWILSISPVLQTSRTRLETTLMIIFTRCLRSCRKIIHTGSDDTNEVNFLWRKPFLFKMMKTFFIRGNISQKLQSKWLGCLVFYFFYHENFLYSQPWGSTNNFRKRHNIDYSSDLLTTHTSVPHCSCLIYSLFEWKLFYKPALNTN